MSKTIIRYWASFKIKEGYHIRKEIFKTVPSPEGFEHIDDHLWLQNSTTNHSSLTLTWLNKIRPILLTATDITVECWCEEEKSEILLQEITKKIENQVSVFIKIQEKQIETMKQALTKPYELEIRE